jgi:hypothetical protein
LLPKSILVLPKPKARKINRRTSDAAARTLALTPTERIAIRTSASPSRDMLGTSNGSDASATLQRKGCSTGSVPSVAVAVTAYSPALS